MIKFVIILLLVICIIAILGKEMCQTKVVDFNDSIDKSGLPIVRMRHNGHVFNLLLDTGSNVSYIAKSIERMLDKDKNHSSESTNIVSSNGEIMSGSSCMLNFNIEGKNFAEEFFVSDFDDAFKSIENDCGVRIHGILGNTFFESNKMTIDFSNKILYEVCRRKPSSKK